MEDGWWGDGGRSEAAGWDTTGISSTGSGCLVVLSY